VTCSPKPVPVGAGSLNCSPATTLHFLLIGSGFCAFELLGKSSQWSTLLVSLCNHMARLTGRCVKDFFYGSPGVNYTNNSWPTLNVAFFDDLGGRGYVWGFS